MVTSTPLPVRQIAPDVFGIGPWGRTATMVYLVRAGAAWTLIDAGWPGDGPRIEDAVVGMLGPDTRPAAILLTHDHPDHEGDALLLARRWGCKVHLASAELPIARRDLSAMQAHAMPLDRWVVLPLMRAIGRRRREEIFAKASLVSVASALTPGEPVPGLPGWVCIPTPGHTYGHVSFFRPSDRVLISGDALVTVRIGTIRDLLRPHAGLSGPPWYTTWSRVEAQASVAELARLRPRVLAGGHGQPLTAPDTADQVADLADALTDRTRGSNRATVVNRARVEREPEASFDYLTDLHRELGWNDKLLAVEPLTDGDLKAGSRFRVRFADPVGESVITYHEVERPTAWRTSSTSPRLDVQLTGTIVSTDGSSEVTLRTTLRPRGWLRLVAPLVRRTMHSSWDHHLYAMKRALESAT